ncbi:unnamed protein product [Vitrella brassicaformis CCMP3155]|uniref:DUF2254 domain-containing protein n=2 Tax=Vitrella brassicaformis TaxID=1169539 RepID=A0A0G4ET75_VITBC|nr:unnamed protein product [Vitrella brassicaformis CCMP3155]|eukprot:CEM01181.1 unnamed protein product [Vitrella brassicaformis CCMP3155]
MIASACIAIVTLTFSLTVLALQLFSQQYSPRLLDSYMRKAANKFCLSVFLGSYAYCFSVQFAMGQSTDDEEPYVPELAVNLLFIYLFLVLGTFIFFIHYFTRGMRLESIFDDVLHDSTKLVRRNDSIDDPSLQLFAELPMKAIASELPLVPVGAKRLRVDRSGYIQAAELMPLARQLTNMDDKLVLRLAHRVGDHVTKGTLLGWVWLRATDDPPPSSQDNHQTPRTSASVDEPPPVGAALPPATRESIDSEMLSRIEGAANGALLIAGERTGGDDMSFSIREITDVAVRALSPGVNDPHSAVQAIDRLSVLFATIAAKQLNHIFAYDSQGGLRVAMPACTFATLLDVCMHPLRHYGRGDVAVTRRLLYFLGDLGHLCNDRHRVDAPERTHHILSHLSQLVLAAHATFPSNGTERRAIDSAAEHARYLIAAASHGNDVISMNEMRQTDPKARGPAADEKNNPHNCRANAAAEWLREGGKIAVKEGGRIVAKWINADPQMKDTKLHGGREGGNKREGGDNGGVGEDSEAGKAVVYDDKERQWAAE